MIEEQQLTKTLWDWLNLLGVLAIPVVVGLGTAFFTRQQAKTSEANVRNQQQEELLRTYFDSVSALVLNKEFDTDPNMQSIVRARSLAALHMLSTERKAVVLRFLHDTDLLQYVKRFLYGLSLSYADLLGIDLSEANLSGAKLVRAILIGADLTSTDLVGADLTRAYLNSANLTEADLTKANLSGANLSGANLSGTRVTRKQLEEAKNVTPEQFAQIRPPELAATQEAKMGQTLPPSADKKPEQTS